MLNARLGRKKLVQLDRQLFIDFGKERAKEAAGPMTLSIDIGAIKLVITHAIAVRGMTISAEPVNMARLALKRLGLVGKSVERDRRPIEEELHKLIGHFEGTLSASAALQMGLISSVVPPEDLDQAAQALAQRLAALPMGAAARTRRLLDRAFTTSFEDHLDLEREAFAQGAAAPDFAEALDAYFARRSARFTQDASRAD